MDIMSIISESNMFEFVALCILMLILLTGVDSFLFKILVVVCIVSLVVESLICSFKCLVYVIRS